LPLLLSFLLSACGTDADAPIHYSGATMGTTYNVTLVNPPENLSRVGVERGIREVLDGIDQEMSTYKADSTVSRFNRYRGDDWFPVSARLAAIVAQARKVSEMTGGAFDITVGSLVELWGFGPNMAPPKLPSSGRVGETRQRVGFGHLQSRSEPAGLRKTVPALQIDLSAIAKGYAVDQVADWLQGQGLKNYLVEVGGELRVAGHNPDGGAWRVAVERPVSDTREAYAVLAVKDSAVATSGDYRNYFEVDGQRYSHAIDPLSGAPVRHDLVSVTVLSAKAGLADALATGLLVLGPEAGYRVADSEGLAVLFIERHDGKLKPRWTPGFMHAVDSVDGL
jgi:thiamine biosynthesis lipoprotein